MLQSMWSQRVGHDWVTEQQKISTEFQWLHYAWEFSEIQSTFKVIMLCLQPSQGKHWQFVIEPEHVSKAKRNQQSYEKHEIPRNPVIFFLTHVNPCISYSLTLKMTQRKKEKASTVLFFSFFLNLISKSFLSNSVLSHRSKVLTECAHIKKWNKLIKLVSHSISILLVTTKTHIHV